MCLPELEFTYTVSGHDVLHPHVFPAFKVCSRWENTGSHVEVYEFFFSPVVNAVWLKLI